MTTVPRSSDRPPDLCPIALAANDDGLAVLPPKEDGSKAPDAERWREYQQQRPSRAQVAAWYARPRTGIGYIGGAVSGKLECLDFDDPDTYRAVLDAADVAGLGELLARIRCGYESATPSGTAHLLYRSDAIAGNTKLARRPKRPEEMRDPRDRVKVLVETRGEGGYIVEAPSYGTVHPSGKPYVMQSGGTASIVTITPAEREELHRLCRSFDQLPEKVAHQPPRVSLPPGGAERPGDHFNRSAHWADILTPFGWVAVYQHGAVTAWRRPGKDRGISATTNYANTNYLYCFSTSTVFTAERGYSPFSAWTLLNYGGDVAAAASALASRGYGTQTRGRVRPFSPLRSEVIRVIG